MIFRKTQNGEILTYERFIEMESCLEIKDIIFKALWPNYSSDVLNLRFRYKDNNTFDYNTSLLDIVDDQDAVIDCDILPVRRGNVQVYYVLETGEPVDIPFTNCECVMNLKEHLATKLRYRVEEFLLFLENEWLNDKAFIYQYEINDTSVIKYVFLDNFENFEHLDVGIFTGGHSDIFNARNKSTGEIISVKRYQSSLQLPSIEAYKPMIRQIVSFTKIGDHPRFVQLKAFYMKDGDFYLGLELVNGGSLHELIERTGGPLEEKIIARLAQEILEALNEMDDHHIYHCYLNSKNILLGENKEVKISGFSLSRFIAGKTCDEMIEDFTTSKKPSTLNFSAIEILDQEESGLKSDIWSFGAILIQMVTGQVPFDKMTNNQIIQQITDHRTIPYEAPNLRRDSPLRIMIDRCLKMKMEDRPRPKDLLNEFSEFFNMHNSS